MPIGLLLFIAFVVVPLAELYLLVKLSEWTSFPTTIAVVILTGAIGAALARWQGFQVVRRMQDDLRKQRLPADAMMDGVMILIAAGLLLTPGLLTDGLGFSLLIPWCRRGYRALAKHVVGRSIQIQTFGDGFHNMQQPRPNNPDVIDTTFVGDRDQKEGR